VVITYSQNFYADTQYKPVHVFSSDVQEKAMEVLSDLLSVAWKYYENWKYMRDGKFMREEG